MEGFEKYSLAAETDPKQESRLFERQVSELQLTQEDLEKKILDVGADLGQFSNEAKRRGYKNIYSIDVSHPDEFHTIDSDAQIGAGTFAVANALHLPFKDQEFDLTVSFYSMPHMLARRTKDTEENRLQFRSLVSSVIDEMLRVTKLNGEIRLGGIPKTEGERGSSFSRWSEIREVLKKLVTAQQIDLTTAETPGDDPNILVCLKKLAN
jgi:SAM-dependent methyltransferase